jgi:hypothetical protein
MPLVEILKLRFVDLVLLHGISAQLVLVHGCQLLFENQLLVFHWQNLKLIY